MTIQQGNLSLIKREGESNARGTRLSSKALEFAHEGFEGQRTIDLTDLNVPTRYIQNGFEGNPTSTELMAARIDFFSKRLTLISSYNGRLINRDSYVVTSPTTIQLIGEYETDGGMDTGEVIYGIIEQSEVATIPKEKIIRRSHTVSAGQTVVPLGITFRVGQGLLLGSQVGDILVINESGQPLLRNVGNAAADISADGDFHEVDSGNGYGNTIELNEAPTSDIKIIVEYGIVSPTGDADFFTHLQKLSSAIIELANDAAFEFHAENDPLRYINASPSEIDVATFGRLVIDNKNDIIGLEQDVIDLETAIDDKKNKKEIQLGVEFETGDTFDGKTVYEYWNEIGSDITSNTIVETIDSGLEPIGILNFSGDLWTINRLVSGDSTNNAHILYDVSVGEIRVDIGGSYKVGAGTRYGLRYTKA
jgi:hypothetical protein